MDLRWSCKLKKNGVISCQAKLPDYNMIATQGYYRSSADYGQQMGNPFEEFMARFHGAKEPCCLCVYATWCGHCKALKDPLGKTWNDVKNQNGENNVLLLDSDKDAAIVQQLGLNDVVQGYPTVLANFEVDQAGNMKLNGDFNQMSRNRFVKAVEKAAVKKL